MLSKQVFKFGSMLCIAGSSGYTIGVVHNYDHFEQPYITKNRIQKVMLNSKIIMGCSLIVIITSF